MKEEETARADMFDLLDLDKWEKLEGFGSTRGPICPNCHQLINTFWCKPSGIGVCPMCNCHFAWQAGDSPVGFAYTTFKVVKRQSS